MSTGGLISNNNGEWYVFKYGVICILGGYYLVLCQYCREIDPFCSCPFVVLSTYVGYIWHNGCLWWEIITSYKSGINFLSEENQWNFIGNLVPKYIEGELFP